jgi:uncharacterized repeat protein (TIGR01451 family)
LLEDRAVPAVLYDEAVSGDLSNNPSAPTQLTAALGVNSVLGTVGGGTGSQDWLTLHVPAGMVLDSLVLFAYSSADPQGFIGVQSGSAFVGNQNNPSSYLGYAHFGTSATNGNLPPTNLVGDDLLPIMGDTDIAFGAQGFEPPLASGAYTFLIQQLGSNTTYRFDYVTESAPAADLVVDKSHANNFRQGNLDDTYSISVSNSGNAPTTGTVTISDLLPAGLTPTAANSGIINGWNVSTAGQTVTATRSDVLAAGNSYPPLIVTVTVADDAPPSVVNTATVSGGGEANTANNSDDDPTTIEPGLPNLPPENTLPLSFAGTEDTALVLGGISVSDPDAGSASIRVTLSVASGTLTLKTNVAGGVTAAQVGGNGTAAIVITASQSAINATLADAAGLTFQPALNVNGDVALAMLTSDLGRTGTGGAKTDSDDSIIALAAVNDAPVNVLPGSSTTSADTPVALTGISVSDPDAGAALVSVVLVVTDGTLLLSTSVAGGVLASEVNGNGSSLLTVQTTLAQLNATLGTASGLVYTPAAGFSGTATLLLQSNDLGSTGAGGPRTDGDLQSIFVTGLVEQLTIDLAASTVAGASVAVTVTARDGDGDVVTSYGGVVHLTTSDGSATLPPSATFVNGVATFAATLRTAGPQTIRATDAAVPSITTHRTIAVTPATAVRLDFQQQPTGVLVGAPFLPAVQVVARDAFGNLATNNSTAVVRIRVPNNPGGAVPVGVVSVRLVNGVATFPTLGISKAGNALTLSASSSTIPTTISDPFNVSAVAGFAVTASPTTIVAGSAVDVTVRALDAKGQLVTGYAGKVHFTSSDPQAVLPADSTLTNGEATFQVSLRTSGPRTIAVADLGKPTARGTTKPVIVTPAAVVALRATGLVDPTTVGKRQMLTVAAVDAFGNINPGYRGTVALVSSDPSAVLPAPFTYAARDAGKHAFPVTLNTAGLQSLTAADGTLTIDRDNIVVAGRTPTVVTQPDPADPAKTALVVIGTSRNDTIEMSPTNAAGTQFEVRFNGVPLGSSFAPSGHLLAYGLAGNDAIRLLPGTGPQAGVLLTVPSVIDGGLGNDTVDASGSSAPAILVGRDGNDNLTGSSGRDVLIGGRGKEALRGGASDDVVVASATTLDADLTGLLAVMAEWSDASTDYVTRVQHLSGMPGGLNGPHVLTAATVPNDTSVDQLFGDADRDWFLFTASGAMIDQVADVVDGEVLTGF